MCEAYVLVLLPASNLWQLLGGACWPDLLPDPGPGFYDWSGLWRPWRLRLRAEAEPFVPAAVEPDASRDELRQQTSQTQGVSGGCESSAQAELGVSSEQETPKAQPEEQGESVEKKVSVPVLAPGFPVPCLGGETQGQVQGGLGTDLRADRGKAAVEARLAAEAKAADEARLAEEARLAAGAKAAEEARLAAEAKAAEEMRLAAEAKVAEEARLAAEAKAAEEARLTAEAKAAEEARLDAGAKAAGEACDTGLSLLQELQAAEERAESARGLEALATEEGSDGPAGFVGDDGGLSLLEELEKIDLVNRIKALQRANQLAKIAWWAHCEEAAGGTKDPDRHPTASLKAFLNRLAKRG
jgi:hypothetical protein